MGGEHWVAGIKTCHTIKRRHQPRGRPRPATAAHNNQARGREGGGKGKGDERANLGGALDVDLGEDDRQRLAREQRLDVLKQLDLLRNRVPALLADVHEEQNARSQVRHRLPRQKRRGGGMD